MDIGLPAQLGRPNQVAGPVRLIPPLGQAAPVDLFLPARPLQRLVRRLLPRLAGLVQPVPGLGRPRFPRTAHLRGLPVVAPEPLLRAAINPVMAPLRIHQVRVGVLPIRPAAVDRHRVRQLLLAGQIRAEAPRPPARRSASLQLLGQGELDLAIQPSVGPLVLVCRRPVRPGVVLGPLRHIAVLFVFQFLPVVARSGPRAQCNHSWRGLTAHRRGNRSSLLDDRQPPYERPLCFQSAHAVYEINGNSVSSLSFGYRSHRHCPLIISSMHPVECMERDRQ